MTDVREIDGFCTDCGNWTDLLGPIGDRRCRCGSGRVAVPPAGYRILGPDEVAQLERIAKGDIPGVWQEKFEKAQKIASAIGRKA